MFVFYDFSSNSLFFVCHNDFTLIFVDLAGSVSELLKYDLGGPVFQLTNYLFNAFHFFGKISHKLKIFG